MIKAATTADMKRAQYDMIIHKYHVQIQVCEKYMLDTCAIGELSEKNERIIEDTLVRIDHYLDSCYHLRRFKDAHENTAKG